ncbi:unnamed protein product [Larinioides sclopetarius]|uniref:Uncharacterized protein n=1 Tax=Larinioides sclopetarius TaxID=280406 RepID=A0AAV1Z0R4_9ARAC
MFMFGFRQSSNKKIGMEEVNIFGTLKSDISKRNLSDTSVSILISEWLAKCASIQLGPTSLGFYSVLEWTVCWTLF